MKKILFYILVVMNFYLFSCSDYLDVSDELSGNLTIEQVFNNASYTRRWYSNIYSSCISEYSGIFLNPTGFNNPWASLCGEVTVNYGTAKEEIMNGFTASTAQFHRYSRLYQAIRQALIFQQNVRPMGNLSDMDYLSQEEVDRMKSEADFLIAYSYFSLFELYGPVPIMKGLASPDQRNFNVPRATVDETVAYIDSIYAKVLSDDVLPATLRYDDGEGNMIERLSEVARPTKAVVLAMRAKLWVYAASKLFNGGYPEALELVNQDGKHLFPPYSKEKWVTAEKHLKAFLDFAHENGYELYRYIGTDGKEIPSKSVYELFQNYNNEIIWAIGDNNYKGLGNIGSNENEARCTPRGLNFPCGQGIGTSQQMVDAFFMKSGLTIHDPGTEYTEEGFSDVINPCAFIKKNDPPRVDKHVYNMYANREPRFYNSITYQGKSWHIAILPAGESIDYSWGGSSDDSKPAQLIYSGYQPYKKINQTLYYNKAQYEKTWARPNILLRLADFYLYYAEVLNEIDPTNPEIIRYIDAVRSRAGIPGYQELKETGKKDIIGDKELQARAIRQERQVELYLEGQRYFDIRRWMICGPGEEADQTEYWGMNVSGSKDVAPGDPNSFFTRTLVRKHNWKRAMYLYPIPYREVEISSGLVVQNPLW